MMSLLVSGNQQEAQNVARRNLWVYVGRHSVRLTAARQRTAEHIGPLFRTQIRPQAHHFRQTMTV
jgi:hypothetical protein